MKYRRRYSNKFGAGPGAGKMDDNVHMRKESTDEMIDNVLEGSDPMDVLVNVIESGNPLAAGGDKDASTGNPMLNQGGNQALQQTTGEPAFRRPSKQDDALAGQPAKGRMPAQRIH